MSLASYADLQTQVANWLARSDLTAYIPDYITIFECEAARKLKVRPQETTATLATIGGIATLPTDYLGYRSVTWAGNPLVELDYVTPPIFNAQYADSPQGTPQVFTIQGSNLKIMPTDDTSGITFDYFQKTAAISGSLNWLFTNHPDAYLFGTLAEANAFNKNPEAASLWLQRRDAVFDGIRLLDFNERQGMSIRVFGPTP